MLNIITSRNIVKFQNAKSREEIQKASREQKGDFSQRSRLESSLHSNKEPVEPTKQTKMNKQTKSETDNKQVKNRQKVLPDVIIAIRKISIVL